MLYHSEIGFPAKFYKKWPEKMMINLYHSSHAVKAANNDRYGKISLPNMLEVNRSDIFELELDQRGQVIKFCIRKEYNSEYDLCLAISADFTIKTCWLNSRQDNHKTLDAGKYDRP